MHTELGSGKKCWCFYGHRLFCTLFFNKPKGIKLIIQDLIILSPEERLILFEVSIYTIRLPWKKVISSSTPLRDRQLLSISLTLDLLLLHMDLIELKLFEINSNSFSNGLAFIFVQMHLNCIHYSFMGIPIQLIQIMSILAVKSLLKNVRHYSVCLDCIPKTMVILQMKTAVSEMYSRHALCLTFLSIEVLARIFCLVIQIYSDIYSLIKSPRVNWLKWLSNHIQFEILRWN